MIWLHLKILSFIILNTPFLFVLSLKSSFSVKEDSPPVILTQIFTLEGDGDVSKLIADIPLANGKFWTNEAQWSTVEVSASSSFKPTIDGQNVPNYISSYSIGIEDITLTATLSRGKCA